MLIIEFIKLYIYNEITKILRFFDNFINDKSNAILYHTLANMSNNIYENLRNIFIDVMM